MRKHHLPYAVVIASLTCLMHHKTFSQDWRITGNAGTNTSTHFIGTTDNKDLSFRTNNSIRMRISSGGNIGIGLTAPVQKLDVFGNINIGKGFSLYMENRRVLKIDSVNQNTFLGNRVAFNNTTGFFNTANGYQALYANTTGSYNTANGTNTLFSNNDGSSNTANGYAALYRNTSGGSNIATGSYALYNNTTGNYNTANGAYALYNNISAWDNIATGEFALYSNTIGNRNIASGKYTLFSNVSGGENIASGSNALYSNTSGSNNIASGESALYNNNTGNENIAAGTYSLFYNTTGSYNIANGYQALLTNTTGSFNVGVGINALNSNYTGGQNTAVGTSALSGNYDSWNNTAIGHNAGYYYVNGWNNTFVGAEASATFPGCYNSIAIGNVSYVTAPNQVRLGNYYTSSIGGYASWSNISDGRVKKNVKQNVPGLAFINKLNPVTYNLDLDVADKIVAHSLKDKDGKQLTQQRTQTDINARNAKQQIIYTGFIAQEVEKAAKELNYNFSEVDAAKNDKDLYALRYSEFVVPLVKAVQELSKENDELKKEAQVQQKINSDLQQRLEKIESMMNVQSPDMSSSKQQMMRVNDATLQQNIPNPFNQTTTINYSLPQQSRSAKIVITDKSGKILKEMHITAGGKNSVVIDASTLSAGTYQYSLYADGKLISTKQMVLTK